MFILNYSPKTEIHFNEVFIKLSTKYYNTRLIIDKIRVVAYKLDLHFSATIHMVFHIS